jgi:sugar O-acyltransferase (sialic acid O-acetyltransferase NeuD family)
MAIDGQLIIVGGGGFGTEVFCWARDCHDRGLLPPVVGFLDDEATAMKCVSLPHLGALDSYVPQQGDAFLMALGKPQHKQRVFLSMKARGAHFATLIHPTAIVTDSATLGEGVIMCPFSIAMPNTSVGTCVSVLYYSAVGHDASVGDFSSVSSQVDLTGFARIGAGVTIGSGARVLPGVSVGDGATVGAGAVVVRSVKPGSTVFAPPAKVLRMPMSRS